MHGTINTKVFCLLQRHVCEPEDGLVEAKTCSIKQTRICVQTVINFVY